MSGSDIKSRRQTHEKQRAELEVVLASEVFRRAPGLVRTLTYLCEKYFQGDVAALNEYSIAVEGLGRKPDFEPHEDSIVRVNLRALRKRLP